MEHKEEVSNALRDVLERASQFYAIMKNDPSSYDNLHDKFQRLTNILTSFRNRSSDNDFLLRKIAEELFRKLAHHLDNKYRGQNKDTWDCRRDQDAIGWLVQASMGIIKDIDTKR